MTKQHIPTYGYYIIGGLILSISLVFIVLICSHTPKPIKKFNIYSIDNTSESINNWTGGKDLYFINGEEVTKNEYEQKKPEFVQIRKETAKQRSEYLRFERFEREQKRKHLEENYWEIRMAQSLNNLSDSLDKYSRKLEQKNEEEKRKWIDNQMSYD